MCIAVASYYTPPRYRTFGETEGGGDISTENKMLSGADHIDRAPVSYLYEH